MKRGSWQRAKSAIVHKAEIMQPPFQSKRAMFGDGHASELILKRLEATIPIGRPSGSP